MKVGQWIVAAGSRAEKKRHCPMVGAVSFRNGVGFRSRLVGGRTRWSFFQLSSDCLNHLDRLDALTGKEPGDTGDRDAEGGEMEGEFAGVAGAEKTP